MSLRLAVSGAQVKQLKAVLHFLGKVGEACTSPALVWYVPACLFPEHTLVQAPSSLLRLYRRRWGHAAQ